MKAAPQVTTLQLRGRPAGVWRIPGPPGAARLLLIHGLGASSHIWEPLARALPEGLDLLALDLPGSGATAAHGALDPAELARFTLELMDASGLPRAEVVAGCSLGG